MNYKDLTMCESRGNQKKTHNLNRQSSFFIKNVFLSAKKKFKLQSLLIFWEIPFQPYE